MPWLQVTSRQQPNNRGPLGKVTLSSRIPQRSGVSTLNRISQQNPSCLENGAAQAKFIELARTKGHPTYAALRRQQKHKRENRNIDGFHHSSSSSIDIQLRLSVLPAERYPRAERNVALWWQCGPQRRCFANMAQRRRRASSRETLATEAARPAHT